MMTKIQGIRLMVTIAALGLMFVHSANSSASEVWGSKVDGLDGILDLDKVAFDKEQSGDGRGSLRIEAVSPGVVRLYKTGDIDVENARLVYRARLRSQGLKGTAYLEMWCVFNGMQYFSRGLNNRLMGDRDWETNEIPFFLRSGENPDDVWLNLVIEGQGTVWIDDIQLLVRPLD